MISGEYDVTVVGAGNAGMCVALPAQVGEFPVDAPE